MTLNEIIAGKHISVRAYNSCRNNNLYNLNLILDYYSENLSFKKLRNCGENTNQELIEFCKQQLSNIENTKSTEEQKKTFLSLASALSRKQREVINSFIYINTNSLSNRSQNAVKLHLRGNIKIKNFALKILDSNLDVGNMHNVGKKSIPEIQVYINIVKEFFNEISLVQDEKKLTFLRNRFSIQKTFALKQIPEEVLKSESIFLLTNFLLEKNAFFDKKESLILKKSLNIYDGTEEILLDDIGKLLDLSRERVRQVRKKILEDLNAKFEFLMNFNDDLYSNYGIEENASFIFLDDELKNLINNISGSNFSNDFITYILYAYQSNSYDLIGNIEDVLQTNYFNHRNRHNWNSFYLINKEISGIFNFENFLNDVSNRLEERISETYTFNFKSYLSNFLIDNKIAMLENIMPIAEKVLFEELNIIIDLEDNISFKRNTNKLAFEYAFEALEYLGKPSKVEEIANKVNELYPNYETDENKIRVCMKRKYGFVPIGRRSIFGLKKWEKELDNFKGGTIRTISKEFLLNFEEPKHKKEIEKHVKQFRPKTNANSIYNNLYIDESKTFVFFENYYIGLKSKNYSDNYKLLSKTALPSKKTWAQSLEALNDFILNNGRLPYSSGCPEEEQKLYRWLNVQKSKAKRDNLEENQKKSIESVIERFEGTLGKRRTNNEERFDELKEFIFNNSRLPSANKDGEQNLYAFYYKQRKKYRDDELNEDEKQKIIEVALLLQKT